MDADLLVFENVDDLMTMPLPEPGVACVPDCTCNPFKHEAFDKSWTLKNCAYSQQQPLQLSHTSRDNHHIFNSGVSMFTPSQANWDTLRNTLDNDDSVGSLLFGDQEFSNIYTRADGRPRPMNITLSRHFPSLVQSFGISARSR